MTPIQTNSLTGLNISSTLALTAAAWTNAATYLLVRPSVLLP